MEVCFPWLDESTGKALVVGIISSGVGDDNALAWILLSQTGEAKVYEYDEMNMQRLPSRQPTSVR